MHLDHVVIAAADLEAAKREFFEMTGVMPADGGPHPGGGTRNALVTFSDDCYLEIIAPDYEQEIEGTKGERFAALTQTELLHWAVRVENLETVSAQIADAFDRTLGVPGPIYDMARNSPEGDRLQWRLMGLRNHEWGGLLPFFIDWQKTPHPSKAAPSVGSLLRLQLSLPASALQEAGLGAVLGAITQPQFELVDSVLGDVGLKLRFESPKGIRGYEAQTPNGFSF